MPSLRPPLELCRDTGVSIGRDSRILIAADAGGVAKALARRLERNGASVTVLDGALAADGALLHLCAFNLPAVENRMPADDGGTIRRRRPGRRPPVL